MVTVLSKLSSLQGITGMPARATSRFIMSGVKVPGAALIGNCNYGKILIDLNLVNDEEEKANRTC